MRYSLPGFAVGISVASLCSTATAQTFTFEDPADMSSFTQVATGNNAPGGAFVIVDGSASGVAGSDGITYSGTTDTTAILGVPIDLTTLSGPITLSIDFRTSATLTTPSTNAMVMLGLVHDSDNGFGNVNDATIGNIFVGSRVRHTSGNNQALQAQVKSSLTGSATSTPADPTTDQIVFVADNWYRLTLDIALVGTSFNTTTNLFDIGSMGTGAPLAVTTPLVQSLTNAALAGDSSVFAAFRAVPNLNNVALDNFTVVPEPGTCTMLIGGVAALGLYRRRRP